MVKLRWMELELCVGAEQRRSAWAPMQRGLESEMIQINAATFMHYYNTHSQSSVSFLRVCYGVSP